MNKKASSRAASVLVLAVLLLVLYGLSSGPAILLLRDGWISEEVFFWVYAPMLAACDTSDVTQHWQAAWLSWWWGEDVRSAR